jgi:hypothetical protein
MSTTTAATEARRAATEEMLHRLTLVLRQMWREHAAVTVAAVARRAAPAHSSTRTHGLEPYCSGLM